MVQRSGIGESPEHTVVGSDPDDILWAKYLDYCSARICDVLMELGEERVYELACGAEKDVGAGQGSLTFRQITAVLVDKLVADLSVPDYDSWAESYRRTPERYDPYLLGLWRTSIQPNTTPSNLSKST